jgi:hypothetical protein
MKSKISRCYTAAVSSGGEVWMVPPWMWMSRRVVICGAHASLNRREERREKCWIWRERFC